MTELTGMTREELTEWMAAQGQPAFRGRQVFEWIHRGADFDEMTNLSKALREELKRCATAQPVAVRLHRTSSLDGTVKLLFSMKDGNCVEGVLMHYKYGVSLCISTQVGCRMGCRFCASTLDGKVRDLTAGEMLGEVLAANRFLESEGTRNGEKVSHIVLMGSGEPLDNYDEVIRFLRLLREEDGIRISLRNVSLSTCGIVPRIYDLAKEKLPVTLCVSLHAPNDEIRRRIMPIANKWPIREILEACRFYISETGRRVVFEYALTDGVNAGQTEAEALADILRGMQCHVNLIPLNEVKERQLKGVSDSTVQEFMRILETRHISVTRRREMGDDIEGACGQLRRTVINPQGAEENEKV